MKRLIIFFLLVLSFFAGIIIAALGVYSLQTPAFSVQMANSSFVPAFHFGGGIILMMLPFLYYLRDTLFGFTVTGAGSGVYLIARERKEQIQKHFYDLAHDRRHNGNGELLQAAEAIVKGQLSLFPSNWRSAYAQKVLQKSAKERYVIAATLIAAHVDLMK